MAEHSQAVSDAMGTLGTVCWTVQLIPQIWYNYRRQDCTGFPPIMMFLWLLCGVPFSIYFLVSQPSIAVQVQPVLFTVLCSVSWVQTMYYPPVKLSVRKIATLVTSFFLVAIGLEVGFIIFLKPLYQRGVEWPDLIFGILASILLALGLVPPYFELAKRQGRVVGINFIFLAVDCSGLIFSMVSVLTGSMDIMGMTLYSVCIFLEIGIFTSQLIWYLRFRVLRKQIDQDEEKVTDEDDQIFIELIDLSPLQNTTLDSEKTYSQTPPISNV